MSKQLYDVVFSGELADGVAVDGVKRNLIAQFGLGERHLQRLLSGEQVTVKRSVDAATGERYLAAFREAGALAHLVPTDTETAEVQNPRPSLAPSRESSLESLPQGEAEAADVEPDSGQGGLRLLPLGTPMGQLVSEAEARFPDTSELSLVPGPDWSLEDCQPAQPAPPTLDLTPFSLVPLDE